MQRTLDKQAEAFAKSAPMVRDETHFREKIIAVKSVDDLVGDRRLMTVLLGAFGLSGDINNRFFIRKVLEEGVDLPGALANRLADKRYFAMAEAIGFSGGVAPTSRAPDFADKIITAYRAQSFEAAVGAQNPDMRFALALKRDLTSLAAKPGSDNAKWYTLMGTPPLRKVFDTAFGLPSSFAALDLDRQLSVYQERAQSMFGDSKLSQFADPEKIEELTTRFLVRAQLTAVQTDTSPAAFALQMLQNMPRVQRPLPR
ncbi:DUF1217 domain-containing protein [Roseicitreum antarcticum]|uniref:DUF1217 domain-containing protein n=1 Tax=Roseicitreum antarcticum TaxID=564137 RepID=UPI001CC1DBDD|nr:DUF1217 domain-containing protein [Roseicitreum antarcticum]